MRLLLALCLPTLIACTSESSVVSDASASEATKEMAAEAIEAADKMASEMAEATEDMASKAAEKMDDMHDKMGMEDAVATSPMEPDMDPIEGLRAHILDFSAKPEHTCLLYTSPSPRD